MTLRRVDPFTMALDFRSGALQPYASRVERHVSDLRGAFADSNALEALVARRLCTARAARAERPALAMTQAGGAARVARPLGQCTVVVTPRSFGMYEDSVRRDLERAVGQVRYRPGPLAATELLANASQLLSALHPKEA
jgi:hypothetical protein